MTAPDLFTFKGPMLEECDLPRLNTNARRIWDVMADGLWHNVEKLADMLKISGSGATACVRAFRYDANGGHTVNMKRQGPGRGTWLAQLVPNTREGVRAAKARAKATDAKPADELLELREWLAEQINAGLWNFSSGAVTLAHNVCSKIDETVRKRPLPRRQ